MASTGTTPDAPLSPSEYYAMGLVLTAEGLLGMLLNGLLLLTYLTSDSLRKPRSLLGISLCIGDFGIALMCPFAATASFKETWLFGDHGCQLYAFAGMLFGTVSITALVSLAADKCFSALGREEDDSGQPYLLVTSAIWLNALFWAVTPLHPIGWGRYDIEPPKTTCMLDFADRDVSYLAYLAAMMGVVYVVPIGVLLWCLAKLRKGDSEEGKKTAADKEAIKMCVLVLLSLIFYWGAYGVVALWAAGDDIVNVPLRLVAAAPLLAKICPIGNAALQALTNHDIRCLKAVAPRASDKQK